MLTGEWDRWVDSVAFSPDSRTIYLTAECQCHDRVFQLPADGGGVWPAFPVLGGAFSGLVIPSRAAAPVLVARWQSMIHPSDVESLLRELLKFTPMRSPVPPSTKSRKLDRCLWGGTTSPPETDSP
jgi:hypothetical protein